MNEEQKFRRENNDCYIPRDFSKVHKEYANLPEYLRRWCIFKENQILRRSREGAQKGLY